MRPVLFDLHLFSRDFALHTYGVAIAVAFLVAIFVGTRTAARTGEDPDKVRDLCFWLLVSSLVGARLVFIATNVPDYVRLCRDEHDCFRALRVWEGGLVFYGGFFAALAVAVYYTRRHAHEFLAHRRHPRAVGGARPLLRAPRLLRRRLLLGQRGAGRALSWAARFPSESLAFQDYAARGALPRGAEVTPALHPVQLYEAFGELALFFALSMLGRRKRWDGQVLVA